MILFSYFESSRAGLPYLWKHLLFVRADGIFWTIPQEMLFYLLLPLLAQAHAVLFRRNFALSAAAFLLFAAVCQIFLDESVLTLNGNGKQVLEHRQASIHRCRHRTLLESLFDEHVGMDPFKVHQSDVS